MKGKEARLSAAWMPVLTLFKANLSAVHSWKLPGISSPKTLQFIVVVNRQKFQHD